MQRDEQRNQQLIQAFIALGLILVFVVELITPLGFAEWVIYILPVAATLFVWQANLPLLVGFVATLLLVIGFFVSPPRVDPQVAIVNRFLGLVTIWVVSVVCYLAVKNRLKVRREEWFQRGQTMLSERMVGEQRLEPLCENIIRSLAEYLNAKVATIFVEDGSSFQRVAGYAVSDSDQLPRRINAGEGMIGQAIKTNSLQIINDIPSDYLPIASSLGRTSPKQIVIYPISVDGIINSVIELGFLDSISNEGKELLNRIMQSVALSVKSAKYRSRLQELLEETQRQSEELQAQSEELRVSNEELEEQGKALMESQSRLELQQAELEQINTQLEEQTQLLESQKDELVKAKSSLEKRGQELQQASKYKSEFLANMSHELRTPLNSSLILSKLLADNREGNLTEEQIKFANTIHSSGNDLLLLINDILDLSKIEAGRLEISQARVSLSTLVENLRQTFNPLAKNMNLDFRIETSENLPTHVISDGQRLEQVLRNLVSNAIKFTENGNVVVRIEKESDQAIKFAVKDTGIGIPHDKQEVIFEAFRQADGTTNRKFGGTGLGLSISRQLSTLLGGGIQVESQVGKGSTFTLYLPIDLSSSKEALVPPKSVFVTQPAAISEVRDRGVDTEGTDQDSSPTTIASAITSRFVDDDRTSLQADDRRILIVEDDETFARILVDLCRELKFQCIVAMSAQEGIALAIQFSPHAVLLDIGLPDQSGLSVLDRLKRDARTRHIPVHVISASDYAATAMTLGAVGYLLKPVKREQLVVALEGIEHRLTEKMRRVLIVEDDAVQLESLQHLLRAEDVETVGASTASECLELLGQRTFDCMVLDLSLPDASGFALLEKLSMEDRYSFPPVIVYTGRDLSADEEQKLRQYSKSIIIKGAKSPERLLDEVTLFLHQVVSELPEEQQEMLKTAQSRDLALEGRTILVVEDDVRNVFALTSILEPKGIKVLIARNGREALEVLHASFQSNENRVDLVLMDLMMPEMDGLTAMREIRKRDEWKRLPIIALTAKAMKNDQEQCIEAGANDYMAKPLDVEKLLSLVRVWMPR